MQNAKALRNHNRTGLVLGIMFLFFSLVMGRFGSLMIEMNELIPAAFGTTWQAESLYSEVLNSNDIGNGARVTLGPVSCPHGGCRKQQAELAVFVVTNQVEAEIPILDTVEFGDSVAYVVENPEAAAAANPGMVFLAPSEIKTLDNSPVKVASR